MHHHLLLFSPPATTLTKPLQFKSTPLYNSYKYKNISAKNFYFHSHRATACSVTQSYRNYTQCSAITSLGPCVARRSPMLQGSQAVRPRHTDNIAKENRANLSYLQTRTILNQPQDSHRCTYADFSALVLATRCDPHRPIKKRATSGVRRLFRCMTMTKSAYSYTVFISVARCVPFSPPLQPRISKDRRGLRNAPPSG